MAASNVRVKVPQAFPYQGSKRALAGRILPHLPVRFGRLVEPFAGSGAFSAACAAAGRAETFWLNDVNRPLAELVALAIEAPEDLAAWYRQTWRDDPAAAAAQYKSVRDEFNRSGDPRRLLYLLARCVKGAVRYNAGGHFNQSPDNRRFGMQPGRMRENLRAFSSLLRGRCKVTSLDYREVLTDVRETDVVYFDPPYQGVCGAGDARYAAGVDFGEFCLALEGLNDRGIRYLVSYDGRLGARRYGRTLPAELGLACYEISAGRSTQATLLGRAEETFESLYVSPVLARERPQREGNHEPGAFS